MVEAKLGDDSQIKSVIHNMQQDRFMIKLLSKDMAKTSKKSIHISSIQESFFSNPKLVNLVLINKLYLVNPKSSTKLW